MLFVAFKPENKARTRYAFSSESKGKPFAHIQLCQGRAWIEALRAITREELDCVQATAADIEGG